MTPDEKKPQPHPQQVFDKDLPLGYNDESLAHHLKSHKEWFGGWQGSGCLRNQNGNNHLENQWLNFLKIYNLKGEEINGKT